MEVLIDGIHVNQLLSDNERMNWIEQNPQKFADLIKFHEEMKSKLSLRLWLDLVRFETT